ncbi:Glypican-4 [Tyrophagus putrescentiae]|nr:Glypican-4 [Tyrophagus putrescentiae]
MFTNTYGYLYDKHAAIFNDMFRDLNYYYSTGSVDLAISLKQFFNLLYKKMFVELNNSYAMNATYLECTLEHMEEMMPFGEMPQKLIQQIKRSFVAIRTFVQALNFGNEVLKNIMEAPITSSCENRLHAMSYCNNCHNGPSASTNWPCQDMCVSVLEEACFPYHANLNREWNLYVNDIVKLANRLKTSFNIELAVKPINIQVSEAIMTFQENAVTITNRIFSKCGKPPLKKVKRNTYMYNQRLPAKPTSYTTSSPQNLPLMETLISDILKMVKSYKNFWSRLPRNLCSQYSNPPTTCNNHTQRSAEQLNYRDKNNLEIVNLQISTLKLISLNVNNAYNGLETDLENNLRHNNNNNEGAVAGTAPVDDEISGSGDDHSGSGDTESATELGEHSSSTEQTPPSSTSKDSLYFASSESTAGTAKPVTSTAEPEAKRPQEPSDLQPSSANPLPLPLLWLLLGALLLPALRPSC